VTTPAGRRAGTPVPGHALQVIRAGYGLAPGPLVRLATGRPPSRRTCWTARVLGTRHLVQTALTAAAPQPAEGTILNSWVGAEYSSSCTSAGMMIAVVDGPRA
jgi:hypothetical protein